MAVETEDEQIEAIKSWLRENGLILVIGVAVGLAALAGWHFWQRHQASQAQAGATEYQRLMSSINNGKTDDAKRIADDLVKNYAGTPYAAQGDLAMAAYLVSQHKMPAAARRLAWVSQHANGKNLKQLARLRQARVVWGEGKDAQALKLLKDGDPGRFKGLYLSLRGDILASQGKSAAASQAYKSALSALPDKDKAAKSSIQRKLKELGGSEVPS